MNQMNHGRHPGWGSGFGILNSSSLHFPTETCEAIAKKSEHKHIWCTEIHPTSPNHLSVKIVTKYVLKPEFSRAIWRYEPLQKTPPFQKMTKKTLRQSGRDEMCPDLCMFFSGGLTHKYLFTAARWGEKKIPQKFCGLVSWLHAILASKLRFCNAATLIDGFLGGELMAQSPGFSGGSFGMCWKKMVGLGLSWWHLIFGWMLWNVKTKKVICVVDSC